VSRTDSTAATRTAGTPAMSTRQAVYLLLGLALACLPALLGGGVVTRVSELYPLASEPNPYFQISHAFQLWILAPAVVTSGFVLFLAPGALLIVTLGRPRSTMEWIALAFGASILLSVVVSTGAKLLFGVPLEPWLMLGLWVGLAGLTGALLIHRTRSDAPPSWPLARGPGVRRLLWMLGASLVGVALLVPKIFWENFNLDGIEAFEFGRSLATHVLPRWDIVSGVFGFYHNFILFAYPNHFFIALFGPLEAAARVPLLLYILVAFPALVLLIEQNRSWRLGAREEAVLWLALALFTLIQAFNTNYEPFFADLAEMGATDSLAALCLLLACYTLWQRRWAWFVGFAVMTYMATPGGLLLLGALSVSTVAARWPDWRREVPALVAALAVCALVSVAYEFLYAPRVLSGVESQFSAINMVRRLFPPTLTEFVRLNALLIPTGVLPVLSFFFIRRRKDPEAWALAWITLIYFGTLYVQVWTSLHQFSLVMLLPLAVFWRIYMSARVRVRRWLLPAVAVTTAVCLFLSRPQHFQIDLTTRRFGEATDYRIGDYQRDYERAARAGWSLYALVPEDYRLEYPHQPWGTDPYSWIYYASLPKPPEAEINYIVQRAEDPPPQAATRVMMREGVAVYVRDLDRWQRDRDPGIPRVVISPLYEPILRRTYAFFRDYAAQADSENEPGGTPKGGKSR